MTINVVDLVNEIHRDGYGLNGRTGRDFFTEYPAILNAQGNFDSNQDGDFDTSLIFRVNGGNSLELQDHIGLEGTIRLPSTMPGAVDGLVDVPYRATDTVEDVIVRINNAGADVVARLDRQGRLEFKGTPVDTTEHRDFVIRHLEDDGQFLTGYAGLLSESGPDGAFRWDQADAFLALRGESADRDAAGYAVAPLQHPAGWMEVNPEIRREPASIAGSFSTAGNPGETGDGRAALAIAGIRNTAVGIGRSETLDDYFADSVARIGLKGEQADLSLKTSERIHKDLTDLRQSISGVNLDEELAEMIKFQHGYQAAARFITNVNQMLDTIINRMGV